MSFEADRKRLSQDEMLKWLRQDISHTEMVTVYSSDVQRMHNCGIYSCLIPNAKVTQSLANISWDFHHGDGLPGAVEYSRGDDEQVEYLRYDNINGIEPLVIDRIFYGIRPDYIEISEEFCLFHRLYHDRSQDFYFKIDSTGNEHLVSVVEPNKVQIRLQEIRQFLAIKEMHLAIQFDCFEYSLHTLEELDMEKGGGEYREDLMCWGLHYGELGVTSKHRAFSRLLGKRLITPLPKDKSSFWGFAEEEPKKYLEFIIGINENNEEISYTSNPDALADYFGSNPEAPNYLTPVHFSKEVLDKYYQQPGKFSVEDSIIRCGYLWSLQMDNHHDDKVCAWLGDLGRDLPYKEQFHWRSYNIPPTGNVSKTFFRRQILAQAIYSERPEHIFKKRYRELKNSCDECLGWQLLLPLSGDDQYHLKCIRVPATNEQKDFDELVVGLTKVLIDSLNEKKLLKLIPSEKRGELKGSISRLEAVLVSQGVVGAENQISFLRKLQTLRSSSSAHRKGSNYKKIASEFGVENQNLRSVFKGILLQAIEVLDLLIDAVQSEKLGMFDSTNGGQK